MISSSGFLLAATINQAIGLTQLPIIWAVAPGEDCLLSLADLRMINSKKEDESVSKIGDRYYFQKSAKQVYIVSNKSPELAFMEGKRQLLIELLKISRSTGSVKLSDLTARSLGVLRDLAAGETNSISEQIVFDRSQVLGLDAKRFVTFRAKAYGDYKIIASPVIEAMPAEIQQEYLENRTKLEKKRLEKLAKRKSNKVGEGSSVEESQAITGTVQAASELSAAMTTSGVTGFKIIVTGVSPKFRLDQKTRETLSEVFEKAKAEYQSELRRGTNLLYDQFRALDRFAFLTPAEVSPTEIEINRYLRSLKFNLAQNSTDSKVMDTLLNRASYLKRSDGLMLTIRLRFPDGNVRAFWPTIDF